MTRNRNTQGSEDTSQARRNMDDVARGHDALEAQHRRVQATAPSSTNQPIQGMGSQATGSEDNSQNVEDMEEVKENTRAMKEQARRVEATLPPDINSTGPQR